MRLSRPLACAVALLVVATGSDALAAPTVAPAGPPVVLVATVAAGTSVSGIAARADVGDTDVRHVLAPLRRVSVEVPAADAAAEARRLDALPGVASVTRAARRYVSAVPNDEFYSRQRAYLAAVNAPAAWSITHGSTAVKIGIVDTGVDVTHPDLDGKIADAYSATGSTFVDNVGHGTFVAGVAAAETGNGVGVAGAGYNTRVLAAKVDRQDPTSIDGYSISTDDEARGIIWAADHGARIINISLGAATPDPTERDAVTYAQRKGALVVAAAGNESTTQRSYPAAYPGVVAVGATDAAGHRASFSNHGTWVDLAAPGTDIYSTTPGSLLTSPGYATEAGTSFSSPLVAGAAALVAARYPRASAGRIAAALTSTAHGYARLGLGTGQVDFAAALRPVTLSGLRGNRARFYPRRDGYRDSFTPTVVLSKRASLSLTIRAASGKVVRTVSATRAAGRVGLTWRGTTAAGRRVEAGRYTFRFSTVDALGNRASSATGTVTVSSKRLVTRHRTLTLRASRASRYLRDASCERVVRSDVGRRLINSCVPGPTRTVQAAYRFRLPRAVSYGTLAASVRGRSLSQPARITGRATRVGGGSTPTRSRTLRSATVRNYALGTVAARGHVSRRVVQLLVGVTNRYTSRGNPSDLDLGRVTLRVTYRVLR